MIVSHVCSAHAVDDTRVFHRECVSLARAGHDVHLFATGERSAPYESAGVTIHPLPRARRTERLVRRWRVADMARSVRPDLYHVHEPELLAPTLAVAGDRPVLWDVHESFLDVLKERDWIPSALRGLVRVAWDHRERQLVRRCAGVVAVTERVAARYRALHDRVVVVSNFPDVKTLLVDEPVERDGRTCVFVGGLFPDRGLEEVVRAMGILRRRDCEVRLVLGGAPNPPAYLDHLYAVATREGVREQIEYRGVLPRTEAIATQHRASIGLVTYLPTPNTMASLANKLVECMGLALPVVFSNYPNYVEVAGDTGAGIAVDPTSPEAVADAIEKLVRDRALADSMGRAGQHAVRTRFNWEHASAQLLALYEGVLGSGGARRAA